MFGMQQSVCVIGEQSNKACSVHSMSAAPRDIHQANECMRNVLRLGLMFSCCVSCRQRYNACKEPYSTQGCLARRWHSTACCVLELSLSAGARIGILR